MVAHVCRDSRHKRQKEKLLKPEKGKVEYEVAIEKEKYRGTHITIRGQDNNQIATLDS
jgi:hypothetical protein